MSKILALDISTSCTGYTVFNSKNEVEEIDYIDLSKYKGLYEKASQIKYRILDVFSRYDDINSIVVEENLQAFRPGLSSAKTLMTLAQFNGVVRWICFDTLNIEPISMNVNSARKLIGLKVDRKSKKTTKEQVLEWVADKEPLLEWPTKEIKRGRNKGQVVMHPFNYDMADSYVIGKAFLIENCK